MTYPRRMITKTAFTPTGPAYNGSAPGIWRMDEVAYWVKQGLWPNASIIPDQYFPYVSLLLSTTALGNANNNLFVDSSGAFNPVSRNGNTTQGSFTPYSTNWSNYFDGSGDYLSVAANTAFAFGTGDFTVEFWFNASTYRTSGGYFSCMLALGNFSNSPYFRINHDGRLTAGITATYEYYTTSTVQLNTWTHFAVTRSGSTIRLFVNGVLENTQTNSISLSNSLDVYAGTSSWLPSNETFTGYLSNVRVVKGTAVYTATFTPSTTPLTAISGTSLLTCQSNRFRDASSNAFTITVNGNTSVTEFSPFAPAYPGVSYNQSDITNWSGYFDGTGDYLTVPDDNALDFGTGDFTIEMWINAQNLSSVPMFFHKGTSVSTGWFFQTSGSTLYFGQLDSNRYSTWSVSLANNAWYHIALTRVGAVLNVFVNGVSQGAQTVTNANLSNDNTGLLYIGEYINGTYYYQGYLSNYRIVKGSAVYTANFTPPTTNLTAISGTSLLTLQNAAFTDNSTNNFVVTPFGNTTVTGNSPFNTVGYWSNYFDGATSYLSVPVTSSAFTLNGDFTIEAWVYRAPSGIMTMFDTRTGGNYTDWVVGLNASGQFDFVTVGGAGVRITTTETVTPNVWTHVACVRQGSTVKVYFNGVASVNTATYGTTITPASSVGYIGGTKDPLYSTGYLSNLRLVKGTAVYTANFTPPTAPLTAISGTSLLTCQNGRFIDNSTNAFTITPVGTPSVQSFDPFYTSTIASNGGSMYFDGTGDYLSAPSSPAFNLGTANYTVEFFIYTSSTTSQMVFDTIQPGISGGGSNRFYVLTNTSQQIVVGPATNTLTSSSSIQLGAWNHVAVVRSGTTRTIYINGVSAGSSTQSENLSSSFCTIGFDAASGGSIIMNGYLSNLRVTKGTAVYTANFTPPTAPLTPSANTSLLTNGMNAGIYDATAINDMETVGDVKVRNFTPGNYYAGSFDGSGDYLSTATSAAIALSTADFTFECWVNPTAYPNDATLVYAGGTSTGNEISLQIRNSQVAAHLFVSGGHSDVQFTDLAVPLNTWSHLAISRVSGVLYGFLNGVRSSVSPALTANFGSSAVAYVAVGDRYAGSISNARITKNSAVYSTATYTVPTSPLMPTTNTAFLTCQNTTFIDNSFNALPITVYGGATAGVAGPFTYTSGASAFFDGSGDYLAIRSTPELAFGTGNFTVEAWMYVTASSGDWFIISSIGSGGFFFGQRAGSGLGYGRTGVAWDYNSGVNPTVGAWQHIAISRSGTNVRIFLSGSQIGTTQSSSTDYTLATGGTSIGSQGANYYLNGALRDVRITRGVARYTSNFTPPTQAFPTF